MTTQNQSAPSADATDTSGEVQAAEAVEAIAAAAPDATLAESSTTAPIVSEGAKPASLLDLVRDVAEKTQAEAPPAKDPAEETETPNPDAAAKPNDPASSDAADATGEAKPEDDESLPFHKHPRFQALIKERNSYKEESAQFRAISDYMADTGLAPEEVNRGFEIMAAIRNDPARALEMLRETMTYLNGVTGESLPEDVTKMVDDGEISESAAVQLSKARAQIALNEQRRQEAAENNQRQSVAIAHQQITGAVESWEQQIATRDPDYNAKRDLVHTNIRLANSQTPARNATEALAIAEAAYAKANATVKVLQPKRPLAPAPRSEQSVSHAKPEAKSLGDVVRNALAKA